MMIDFRETIISTFERGKLPKSWLFLSKNVPSSTFVVRTSLSCALLTISICCPVTIGSDTSITTLLVFRFKLQITISFNLWYHIKVFDILLTFPSHPLSWPYGSPLLVTWGPQQHEESSRSTSCMRLHTDLVRPHLQAPSWGIQILQRTYILSHHPVSLPPHKHEEHTDVLVQEL